MLNKPLPTDEELEQMRIDRLRMRAVRFTLGAIAFWVVVALCLPYINASIGRAIDQELGIYKANNPQAGAQTPQAGAQTPQAGAQKAVLYGVSNSKAKR